MNQEKREAIRLKIFGSFLIIGICCFARSIIVNLVALFTLSVIVWGNNLIYLYNKLKNKNLRNK